MPSQFDIANQDLIKIGIAILCGAMLGFERQYKNKTAGFRTIILICLGSTIFTLIAQRAGLGVNINVITGIGFIGAGVIFKDNISVNGLTTAAVIWVSAAIGMAAGSGNYTLALVSTVLTLAVLYLFHQIESYIDKVHHEKLMTITFRGENYDDLLRLEEIIRKNNLEFKRRQLSKQDDCLQVVISITGHRKHVNHLNQELLLMRQIKSF